ncbi:beta-propeller fold lactonase family protein [Bradyrhizobium sp. dw_411]|uniref:lactonase family protein n=1 Tax=Bradyrhizobium sp. dw_411 TaxID=2720082 RepID=UPI001BD1A094|nr:beta-propeller fold lactonase family protein [Bradyrhizobium sp. dw_411]
MVDRRTFTTLLAGAIIAAPKASFGQGAMTSKAMTSKSAKSKDVFYASTGPELTLYDVDVDGATLTKRGTVSTAANIQYAWPHPSKQYLYVVSSDGGPGSASAVGMSAGAVGNKHVATAFKIDPASGALTPHGSTVALPSRPIHTSVNLSGEYLLIAYNNPSNVTVHRINKDGTIGDRVNQPEGLDTGKIAHQIRVTPDDKNVILVTRGNNAATDKNIDPGSIKFFNFKDGVLSNVAAIQPGDGMHFGPRHLDFHPTQPWVYVSIESQNKLYVYKRDPVTGLSRDPIFMTETLADPASKFEQQAGPIHIHPNGHFVYLTNRAYTTTEVEGKQVLAGGENSVTAYAIDQKTGEPKLLKSVEAHANYLRTFGIDHSGRLLVTASVWPMPLRDGTTQPAALGVFRIGDDGKLTFVRNYEVDASAKKQQFWSGMVTLA